MVKGDPDHKPEQRLKSEKVVGGDRLQVLEAVVIQDADQDESDAGGKDREGDRPVDCEKIIDVISGKDRDGKSDYPQQQSTNDGDFFVVDGLGDELSGDIVIRIEEC